MYVVKIMYEVLLRGNIENILDSLALGLLTVL